jgi:carbonic anhydrase
VESGFRWAPFGPSSPSAAPGRAPADATPARRLAVVTCMDARVDPLRALGLKLGDAHVIRNAGAVVTDDVLKSLAASRELAGTTSAVLMAHADCKAHGGDDEVARAVVRNGMRRVREALPGVEVSGAFYDVASGRVSGL